MKLATLKSGTRDGRLVVVSRSLKTAVDATAIVPTMQAAIERWAEVETPLRAIYDALNAGTINAAFLFDPAEVSAPLPRAYQWLDGSAFLTHGELMQRAYELDPIPDVDSIPLMYQGAGDDFLGPHDDVILPSEQQGIDFEGEFVVMLDDVPMGVSVSEAAGHIKLLLQINDVSLRALGPREMRTGFGFVQTKPSSSFAPVAVTPDELGEAWRDTRVHLPLGVYWNEQLFGHPQGGEMHFGFAELIAHAAATRRLAAGTLIGSGTVSNRDHAVVGSACIAERRAIETIASGSARTAFMQFGDRVRMEARGLDDQPLFGAIDQYVRSSS